MKKAVVLALLGSLLGGFVTTVATEAAAGKDDPVKIKAARDAYRKNCKEKQKRWPYYDLVYGVDMPPKVDSRWSSEDVKDGKDNEGIQFSATLSLQGQTESSIRGFTQKFQHKSTDGSNKEFSIPFDRAGKNPKCSDKNGMIEGFYLEAMKTYKEPATDKCVAPKKVKLGVADMYASVTGKDATSGAPERTDIYLWMAPNTTYVLKFTYSGVFVSKAEEFQDKVQDLVKAHVELKNVPE